MAIIFQPWLYCWYTTILLYRLLAEDNFTAFFEKHFPFGLPAWTTSVANYILWLYLILLGRFLMALQTPAQNFTKCLPFPSSLLPTFGIPILVPFVLRGSVLFGLLFFIDLTAKIYHPGLPLSPPSSIWRKMLRIPERFSFISYSPNSSQNVFLP